MTTGQINWESGTWAHDGGETPVAEVILAGDWAPIRKFSDRILNVPEAIYGDLLPVIQDSDLRVVNLECPLVENGRPVNKSGAVLYGLPGHIHGLTTVPFEVVTLGNNHVFDYGSEGFFQTRDLLDQNHIKSAGAGSCLAEAEKPLIVTVKNVRIGIISFSEGEDLTAAAPDQPGVSGWEVDRVITRIKEIRSTVHVIIIICHGGVEYIPFPPPYLAGALKRIAESGADLVIGHHPHVSQGVQIHEGVPICYSLGNFVFFQPTDLLYRKIGYLVKVGIAKDGLHTLRMIPYEIGPEGLSLLKAEKQQRVFNKFDALSRPLTTPDGIADAWHGFLKYYGGGGFKNELTTILNKFETDPPKGAAMFRNRLTTPQHSRHLTDLMTRIINGKLDAAPAWAVEFVHEYFTRKVDEGLPE